MHGGTIDAHSAGNGKGAEFTVRFPISPDPRTSVNGKKATGTTSPKHFGRILIVDDNRDAATLMARLLTLHGNLTSTAFDGLEALDVGPDFQPDAVLLDIGLPKLNGYDTARKIRESAWGRNIALVALTGWGNPEDRRRSTEAGFDGHLVKPVEFDQLTALLDCIMKPK
jgi:DNA-binding response OmpR family regulator